MKIPALAAVGFLGVILQTNTARAVEYSDFNAPPNDLYPNGSTVITGIRGSSDTYGDVVITGSYVTGVGEETLPVIYEGNLAVNNPLGWTILNPTFSDGRIVTTSTLYGPNTGYYDTSLDTDGIRAVGSYKYTGGGEGNHGLMYTRISGTTTWSTIDVPTNIVVSNTNAVINTIAHSTMGNFVVGNYDFELDTGHAFIYNISTNTYTNLVPVNSKSVTAYGIWDNGDGTYTIAGGYSDLNRAGADAGYLVNYHAASGLLTDFTSFQFENRPLSALISHFDGIVGVDGGFSLTGDQISVGTGDKGGFFASVVRNPDGSFGPISWTAIEVPGSEITSGNTVYGNIALGVYETDDGSSSYLATVPEPSTYALIAAGLGALFFLRRRVQI